MKYLYTLLFGLRAPGEKLKEPTLRTVYPEQVTPFNTWCRTLNVSGMSKK